MFIYWKGFSKSSVKIICSWWIGWRFDFFLEYETVLKFVVNIFPFNGLTEYGKFVTGLVPIDILRIQKKEVKGSAFVYAFWSLYIISYLFWDVTCLTIIDGLESCSQNGLTEWVMVGWRYVFLVSLRTKGDDRNLMWQLMNVVHLTINSDDFSKGFYQGVYYYCL